MKTREQSFSQTLAHFFRRRVRWHDPMLVFNMSIFNFTANGAVRFRNTNTNDSTPNESMPIKGTGPRKNGGEQRDRIAVNAPVDAIYKSWLAFEDYPKIHYRNQTRSKIGREPFCRIVRLQRKAI
jgi:hypothetical protein